MARVASSARCRAIRTGPAVTALVVAAAGGTQLAPRAT
jgi:hypothetical protein